MIWCKAYHVPLILMSESKYNDDIRIFWKEKIKVVILHQFGSALCGGSEHKDYLKKLGFPGDRIHLGYDAVDNEYFIHQTDIVRENPDKHLSLPGIRRGKKYFLASARFIKRKNLPFLIYAYNRYCQKMKKAGDEGNRWDLILLGDGDEREELEQLIQDLNLDGVTLAGIQQIDMLPSYYALAGAFIHPALQDQWGLVVNEAMASGLPVLVSSGSGCASELVENGVNGFIFNPTDLDQLSDLMYKISSNSYDLDLMGKASLDKIRQWGPDKFAIGIHQAVLTAFCS